MLVIMTTRQHATSVNFRHRIATQNVHGKKQLEQYYTAMLDSYCTSDTYL